MLLAGYDASTPPDTIPSGYQVTCGYIGSLGATPHVWTLAEWAAALPLRVPIYVPSWFHSGEWLPSTDAHEALIALGTIGCPVGSTVQLDFETQINSTYVNSFCDSLEGNGYPVALYGSASTLMKNPKPAAGYWIANRTGDAMLAAGSIATQYADLGDYDANVIDSSMALWNITPPPPTWLGKDVLTLPTLEQGDTGETVRTLQGLLVARGYTTNAIDGNFGSATNSCVLNFQRRYGLQVDGQVGEHTWGTLITNTAQ